MTVVSQSDLDVLPTALKAASGSTYQSTKTHGSNVEATYYDAAGKVLGYSHSYSNDDGSSGNFFEDSQRNWLGDTFNDPANGYSSSFSSSEIKNSSDVVTGYREIGTSKQVDSDGNTVFERSFDFTYNTSWELQSGTETEGLTTRTYGANWELVSETTNTSSLPAITSTTGIPTALLDSSDASTTKVLVENFEWGEARQLTLPRNGTLLGYSDTWTDSSSGFSSVNYNDAEWNYLGGSFNDTANGFSGSNFSTTQKDGSECYWLCRYWNGQAGRLRW